MPPDATYTLLGPEYLHSLPAPKYTSTPSQHPLMAPGTLHPRNPQAPYATYTQSCPRVPTLTATPRIPMPPYATYTLSCP